MCPELKAKEEKSKCQCEINPPLGKCFCECHQKAITQHDKECKGCGGVNCHQEIQKECSCASNYICLNCYSKGKRIFSAPNKQDKPKIVEDIEAIKMLANSLPPFNNQDKEDWEERFKKEFCILEERFEDRPAELLVMMNIDGDPYNAETVLDFIRKELAKNSAKKREKTLTSLLEEVEGMKKGHEMDGIKEIEGRDWHEEFGFNVCLSQVAIIIKKALLDKK
jgi:hypothetical protein